MKQLVVSRRSIYRGASARPKSRINVWCPSGTHTHTQHRGTCPSLSRWRVARAARCYLASRIAVRWAKKKTKKLAAGRPMLSSRCESSGPLTSLIAPTSVSCCPGAFVHTHTHTHFPPPYLYYIRSRAFIIIVRRQINIYKYKFFLKFCYNL